MPWKETSPLIEQRAFIDDWLKGEDTVTELCRVYDVSRKTGHKFINRYMEWGYEGLGGRSRAPLTHPNKTSLEVERRLIEAKGVHPTWGPKKLVAWLRDVEPAVSWPSPSTAGSILERAGLVRRRKRRRRAAGWGEPFARVEAPNDVWCIDLKGWFRTGDGTRVDPLTVQDSYSRYLLACNGLSRPRSADVRRVLERVFREYGLPWRIRSDNGPPFASVGLGGLTSLAVWWVKLGIIPERIEPGHPEQNGRLERLHRTLEADAASPPSASPRSQQRAFNGFMDCYNQERPHEALGQRPPARVYRPSFREYPARLRSPEYGSNVTVRRVRRNGQIKWKGELVYLSEALRGEPVGLVQQDDNLWTITYGTLSIGLLDDYAHLIIRTPTRELPMSPV